VLSLLLPDQEDGGDDRQPEHADHPDRGTRAGPRLPRRDGDRNTDGGRRHRDGPCRRRPRDGSAAAVANGSRERNVRGWRICCPARAQRPLAPASTHQPRPTPRPTHAQATRFEHLWPRLVAPVDRFAALEAAGGTTRRALAPYRPWPLDER